MVRLFLSWLWTYTAYRLRHRSPWSLRIAYGPLFINQCYEFMTNVVNGTISLICPKFAMAGWIDLIMIILILKFLLFLTCPMYPQKCCSPIAVFLFIIFVSLTLSNVVLLKCILIKFTKNGSRLKNIAFELLLFKKKVTF